MVTKAIASFLKLQVNGVGVHLTRVSLVRVGSCMRRRLLRRIILGTPDGQIVVLIGPGWTCILTSALSHSLAFN